MLSGLKCLKFILYDSHPSLGLANFSKELLELEYEPRQFNYRTQALNCEPNHLIIPQTWEPCRSNTWPFFPSLAPDSEILAFLFTLVNLTKCYPGAPMTGQAMSQYTGDPWTLKIFVSIRLVNNSNSFLTM